MIKHELTPEQKTLCKYIQAKIFTHNSRCDEMKRTGQYLQTEWNTFIAECQRKLGVPEQAKFLAEELAFEISDETESDDENPAASL